MIRCTLGLRSTPWLTGAQALGHARPRRAPARRRRPAPSRARRASQPAVLPVPRPMTRARRGSGCSIAPTSPPMTWVGASARALPSALPLTRKADSVRRRRAPRCSRRRPPPRRSPAAALFRSAAQLVGSASSRPRRPGRRRSGCGARTRSGRARSQEQQAERHAPPARTTARPRLPSRRRGRRRGQPPGRPAARRTRRQTPGAVSSGSSPKPPASEPSDRAHGVRGIGHARPRGRPGSAPAPEQRDQQRELIRPPRSPPAGRRARRPAVQPRTRGKKPALAEGTQQRGQHRQPVAQREGEGQERAPPARR